MNFKTPAFIVNLQTVRQNIERILRKTQQDGIVFRPHFKTHQNQRVAIIFKEYGLTRICVSSVSMARYFASNGFDDITIAFPVNLKEISDLQELARNIHINILLDNEQSAFFLSKNFKQPAGFFIEIDNGYGRSGIKNSQTSLMEKILEILAGSPLQFKGFLSHFGNTYKAENVDKIKEIYKKGCHEMALLKQHFSSRYPDIIISTGDTPSASVVDTFLPADEIRPGNFVYYDYFQYHLGVCHKENIAVHVSCPVVSVYPERNEAVIYGGAVHLSREFILNERGEKIFGQVAEINEKGEMIAWLPGTHVISLSQEHGIIRFPETIPDSIKPGCLIGVVPVHSCLTAHLLKENTVFINQ